MPLRITRRRIIFTALFLVIFLVAGVWLALWYYSFEERFGRSKPALEAYATQVMASDPSTPIPQPPTPLGDFSAERAERLPHGFLFFSDYGHPLDANGLAYSIEPLPSQIGEHNYFRHIEGKWYAFSRN